MPPVQLSHNIAVAWKTTGAGDRWGHILAVRMNSLTKEDGILRQTFPPFKMDPSLDR